MQPRSSVRAACVIAMAPLILCRISGFIYTVAPVRKQHAGRVAASSAPEAAPWLKERAHRSLAVNVKDSMRCPSRVRRSSVIVAMAGNAEDGKFVRMGSAEDTGSFGPNRCVLAGGLSPPEFTDLRTVLEEEDRERVQGDDSIATPLILTTPDLAGKTLGDVLGDAASISTSQGPRVEEEKEGTNAVSLMSPVILVSGFTNLELRGVASRFRQRTGVRAAFAKAVPRAMDKAIGQLFGEIAQDHADALAGRLETPHGL